MNILLLGSGGRECALAWKISQSPLCNQLYIAPGNGGTGSYGINVAIDVNNFEAIKAFCLKEKVDMVLPGSEDPLVQGIYDFFQKDEQIKHIQVAGPSAAGARLEGSKSFAKAFMARHQIPTAAYHEFDETNFDKGLDYLKTCDTPIVLKADGLAAGKGVVITEDRPEAAKVFTEMIREGSFGKAGRQVVIESFLSGIECSVFVLTDGKNYVLLPDAKDYKRIGEGDTGPNTGGMGAVSPVPFVDAAFMQKIKERIVEPTIKGLQEEQLTYQGFIFFGLIKVKDDPYVIEYNCRMGDPETEVVIPRLENDLPELLVKMKAGQLNDVTIRHKKEAATTVMMVSDGYPGSYEKGKAITGFESCKDVLLFHAGTKTDSNGSLKTNGGRVLAATAFGQDIQDALKKSYAAAESISFAGKYYRRDIGFEFSK
ncbi:MAG TPA: phosphoribosylamine--glycine ligase [Edaphocola sp.]|nr:phosphoribosylamine--glycine ligase [Edaphocola sp.]